MLSIDRKELTSTIKWKLILAAFLLNCWNYNQYCNYNLAETTTLLLMWYCLTIGLYEYFTVYTTFTNTAVKLYFSRSTYSSGQEQSKPLWIIDQPL